MLPVLLGAIVGYVLTLVVAPDQISFAEPSPRHRSSPRRTSPGRTSPARWW